MEQIFEIYKVQNGDTSATVAAKFGRTVYQLADFHNKHCSGAGTIGYELIPYYVPEIIMPGKDFPKPMQERKTEPNIYLRSGQQFKHYGVFITIDEAEESKTLKYTVKVNYLGTQEKDGLHVHIYELDRGPALYINEELPEAMADTMASFVASAIYPLTVVVNNMGGLAWIDRFDEVQKRWVGARQKILEAFEGEWAKKYAELNDSIFANKARFQKMMENDWFLAAYFNGLYCQRSGTHRLKRTLGFPWLRAAPVQYAVEQKIAEYIDEDNLIPLTIEGKINDGRTKENILAGLSVPSSNAITGNLMGSYRASYFLDPLYHTIEYLSIEASLILKTNHAVTIIVANLDADIRYLPPSDGQTSLIVSIETLPNKKPTFWNKLRDIF